MNEQSVTSRTLYFDILNIAATICVVWLHFNNEIHWYAPTLAWKQSVFVQALAYWAVPIFFMLSGATLMEYKKKYNTRTFLKRRFTRVFVPFMFWGMVFLLWRISRGDIETFPNGLWNQLWYVINSYVNNGMEPIYWFFAPLFGIYLSIPAMSFLTEDKNRNTLTYLLIVGVIFRTVIPFFYNLCSTVFSLNIGWNMSWEPAILGGYILYPLAGYWCKKTKFTCIWKNVIYINGLAMLLFRGVGIFYLCTRDGAKNPVFFDYLSYPSFSLALAVFVFAKEYNWDNIFKSEYSHKIIQKISSCSFGVYLIHLILLINMQDISFFKYDAHISTWHFLMPIICYSICVGIVFFVKRVPIIKHLFP